MPAIITLLTDYGTRDSYLAEVKGVLLANAPGAALVDVTHDIALGDLRAASYLLSRVWERFPRGTVHFVVVDPGVGSSRRALAAEARGRFFVAPDNGVLSPLPADARFVEVPVPADASPTFHGRDVFAPAAAQLVHGSALTHVGHVITDPYRSPLAAARQDGAAWVGEVVYIDRFGTLVTNLPGVAPGARIRVGGYDVGTLRRTFGDVKQGELVAFVGSNGTVEIAVRGGNAAGQLGVGVGAEVRS